MHIVVTQRVLKNGTVSLYLDYMIHGKRERECLKITLSGKKRPTPEDREKLLLAEKIRAKREHEINTCQHGFVSNERANADFVKYFKKFTDDETEKFNKGHTKSKTYGTYKSTLVHLVKYTGGTLKFSGVTEEWLEGIRQYFLNTLGSPRTSSTYFAKIRAVVNRAYKERIIQLNPVERVKHISKGQSEKHFLYEEELERAIKADCPREVWKQAFLFSCFTGLRLSDVEQLTWGKIQGNQIHFRQEKTDGFEYLPLSKTAKDILYSTLEEGEEPSPSKLVFKLEGRAHRGRYITQWMKNAGIDKQLTFHSSRHTFATLLLTKGVDLYTVSKLLGHQDIQTTLIYAKIIDQVKDNAVSALPIFEVL